MMRYTYAFGLVALASAAPVVDKRAVKVTDAIILNYALSLEHLENSFYKEGLSKFSAADFHAAGTNPGFYSNLKQISSDEETHVSFLTTALSGAGVTPVQPCTYNFGAKDAATFLAVANVLEGVGVSAYLGAAKSIVNKDYLTAAASILTVESRHSAYLRENQSPKQSPFPSAFDIPLDFNEVFSLAALFITSCPQGKAGTLGLGFTPFPAITVTAPAGVVKPGDKLSLTVAKSQPASHAFFITSSGAVPASYHRRGSAYTVTVPANAPKGQGYLVLTNSASAPSDDNIVAGPAVVQIADNAAGHSAGGSGGSSSGGAGAGLGSYTPYSNYGKYEDTK